MFTDTFLETDFWHWGPSCIQQYNSRHVYTFLIIPMIDHFNSYSVYPDNGLGKKSNFVFSLHREILSSAYFAFNTLLYVRDMD